MATNLFTPILNTKTRAPHFFNGRLLSGEAMTDAQRAERVAHELLAEAIGDGVVYGLTIAKKSGSDFTNPIVTVKSGVAINRCGEILLLANDVDVQLVRPAHVATPPTKLFGLCDPPIADASCSSDFQTLQPPQSGTYVADDGVYLLTIASIGAGEGLATVSGLGDTPRGCNIKYVVEAVEFRLLELPVDSAMRADTAHLRNRVAYACFGVDDMLDYATDPFALDANVEPHTLLDDIRPSQLTDCDVPLGVMYWTATSGIQFLDMWSVRRRVAHTRVATLNPALSDRRRAAGEAMLLQFQEEIGSITTGTTTLRATDRFVHLPPVGLLPLQSGAHGFNLLEFFKDLTTRGPMYFEGSRMSWVINEPLLFAPARLDSHELIWLYRVRENQEAIDDLASPIPAPFLLFVTGHAPFRGDSHFDVAKWNYSNYA